MYDDEFKNFKPIHLYDLAKKLDKLSDEIGCEKSAVTRTIVNRTYYATFLHVREWLVDNHEHTPSPTDHGEIPKIVKKIFNEKKYKQFVCRYYALKNNRQQCDYSFKTPAEEENKFNHEEWSNLSIDDLFEYSDEIRSFFK